MYPADTYIAQHGQGQTREAAEASAAAAISRYFISEVRSATGILEFERQTNGVTTETQLAATSEILVNSQTELFAVRYAEAWFNKAEKQWETTAYIDRAEAWAIYEPRFQKQAEALRGLYQAAETEGDLFKKALLWGVTNRYAQSADFEAAYSFGQILNSAKMNVVFSVVRSNTASLPQKIDNARRNADVYIDCPVDFESLIVNAFSRALISEGFPVAKTRAGAAAVCTITVDEGMQKRELGIFYYPSLQAVFTGSSGALFTYNASAGSASAVTPDVAKRRAYTALAEQVQKSFSTEFNANAEK
ncbi:hypothetical protein TREPR_3856 [Treponema primitia ZAS-2]|uniref:Lipoprotein n=1 Tax=Treponema primitia (strain ATCC BAA-887 / DSM 12427 / ZAS-2) TaxID=545694 RepID=F5YP38_TREPZ|nr:hypothetical protein TREPR_3856 [Treponema primitia ZAS-2]